MSTPRPALVLSDALARVDAARTPVQHSDTPRPINEPQTARPELPLLPAPRAAVPLLPAPSAPLTPVAASTPLARQMAAVPAAAPIPLSLAPLPQAAASTPLASRTAAVSQLPDPIGPDAVLEIIDRLIRALTIDRAPHWVDLERTLVDDPLVQRMVRRGQRRMRRQANACRFRLAA